jgi:adenylate kinase
MGTTEGTHCISHLNVIILIGPQGSGKGTQAEILSEALGFFHWDNGGILREIAKKDSATGRKVKQLIDSGILLDDETLLEVAEEKLHELDPKQGIIFDGLPRRLSQADFLLSLLRRQGRGNVTTLFIDIPEQEAYKRLQRRAQIEGRADDQPEKVKLRLHQYYMETVPVLDFLKARTDFLDIDGLPPIEQVTRSIYEALGIHKEVSTA